MTAVTLKSVSFHGIIKMVIIMHETQQYTQAATLLLLLTLISVFFSDSPYICILIAGILMIVFTIRSLSDKQSKTLMTLQAVLTAIFSVLGGITVSCLMGYECRFFRYKALQTAVPSIICGTIQLISSSLTFPEIVMNMLILAAFSWLIFIAEHLIQSYLSAKSQISRAVSVTAVNEMYEKKLNQELVMKNYLADKNARLEERENISRNIHNSVGHSITAAIMTLDAADMLFEASPMRAREKMNAANERIRTSLASIRHAVRVLDSENRLVSISDFISQLSAVSESFVMDTTMQIHTDFTDIQPDLPLPHEHAKFLTGALQELLSNGVRHGSADRFTVIITADSGHIRLSVSDNGISDFSDANSSERIQRGFGLKKLISYTKRCGGSTNFSNENGFGSDISLPLLKEEENE